MVEKIDRRDVLRGAGAAGLVAMAGCAGNGDGNGGNGNGNGGADDTEFEARVGVLLPETGDLGPLGETMRDGALLAADTINDADVDVSVDYQVEDTQTDPQAGISGAEALVSAGYPAVVGSASSNVNLQVSPEVFVPNGVVGMSPSSTAPAVTTLEDNGYIFRTAPSDALQGPVMADVAVDQLGASTSGTLFLNDAYGQALEETYVDGFEERDGQVENRVSFEPEQASYSSQWGEVLNDNPDVVMIVGFPQSGIQLFRDFYQEFASDHEDVDLIVPDGLIDDGLPGEVDNDMANVVGTSPSAAGPGADFFEDAYEDAYGSSPQVFNAQSFDAMAVLTLAAVSAGENEGSAVRDNVRTVANPDGEEVGPENIAEAAQMVADGEEVNYQGASSSVDFDENGDMRAVSYGIFEVQNREFEQTDRIDFEN